MRAYVQAWVDAFDDVIELLDNGIAAPVVDLVTIGGHLSGR